MSIPYEDATSGDKALVELQRILASGERVIDRVKADMLPAIEDKVVSLR